MRVGIVAEQLRRGVPGGIGTYARALIGALAAAGEGPHGTAGRRYPEITVVRSRALIGGEAQSAPVRVRGPRLPSALVMRLWDRGHLRVDGDADLLHAVSTAVPPSQRPVTAMVHDIAWRHFPDAYPERGRAWHEASLTRVARSAVAVAVPSEEVAADLAAAGVGIGEDRITVIPEGSDHLPAADPVGTERFLEGLGIRGDYLLSVSTLEPRKNLSRLLEAYAAARPRLGGDLPLLVVGPAGWGPSLAPVQGTVLGGRVTDEVLSGLYERARAVCYVALWEGFGLPALEAMAAGAPVLASATVPSAAGAALQVDATDVAAIVEALVVIATDESARSLWIARGRARAAELTWADAARAHVAWWEEVAGG